MSEAESERLLIRAAYLEWRVAKAYSTGTTMEIEPRRPPGLEIRAPWLSVSWPSFKFRAEELGFAIEHGPSLAWTCKMLSKTNRDACKILGVEAPLKFTYPRLTVRA